MFTIAFNSDKSIMQSPSISAIISAKASMDTRILGFQSLIEGGEVPWASSTNPHISYTSIQPPRINPWLVGPADRKGWLYSAPILQNAGSLLEIQLSIELSQGEFAQLHILELEGPPCFSLRLFCKNACSIKTLAFGSSILSITLCYYYLPNLCLCIQILMSASHVTSLMLTLLAAGFLELFISSHLQFIHNFSHVFLLSLSRLCYHPEQFYFKNQQLGLLTGLTLLGGSFSFFC